MVLRGIFMIDNTFTIAFYEGKWLNLENLKSNPGRWAKVGEKKVGLEF